MMPSVLKPEMRAAWGSTRLVSNALSFASHGTSPSGVRLPPLRYRMGGSHFRDDVAFVQAGVADVNRLVEVAGLTEKSRLLDWGCGTGRLAIGVKECFSDIDLYHGVDVNRAFIAWNNRNLAGKHFRFSYVNTSNTRYNPRGEAWTMLPEETGSIDVFYAYSVFSHLRSSDVLRYLNEIDRVLRVDGSAFFTAFVEDGVPDEEENPPDYGVLKWSGPLHCVRYRRGFFDEMIAQAGLAINKFEHGEETDGQSLYLLRRGGQERRR